jgi:hypothetical protein
VPLSPDPKRPLKLQAKESADPLNFGVMSFFLR